MPLHAGDRKLRVDGERREQAEDAPGPVPGARTHLSQPRDVAASQDRRGGLRVGPTRALPACRTCLRARSVRHRVLRRPQLHRRHLYRQPRPLASQRGPGAGARPDSAALLHRRGDRADRRLLHLLGEPRPPVLCRAPVGDARPSHARPSGLECGHLAQQQPGRELRRGTPARRPPLRPGARVHGGLPQAVGLVG